MLIELVRNFLFKKKNHELQMITYWRINSIWVKLKPSTKCQKMQDFQKSPSVIIITNMKKENSLSLCRLSVIVNVPKKNYSFLTFSHQNYDRDNNLFVLFLSKFSFHILRLYYNCNYFIIPTILFYFTFIRIRYEMKMLIFIDLFVLCFWAEFFPT